MRRLRAGRLEAAGGRVAVFWVVPGLLAEGRRVAHALDADPPAAVAVGVAPAELDGLRQFVEEPVEDEGWTGEAYAAALSRYGAVGFPPPAYVEAVRFAVERGVPVRGVDLGDDAYDDRFTAAVSTWQWWRYGRRMRRLEKRPPKAPDAEAFAAAWDARLRATGAGIRAVEDARAAAVAAALAEMAREGSVAAVLDVTMRAAVEAAAGR